MGLKLLVQKFENGEDVSPHLSKGATSPAEFDGLLYDWGIYHFHLGETIDNQTGRIKRTGPVLFAKIDDENVYCINIYCHGKNVQQPWTKQDLLKIIHNNWPQTIAKWKLPDGINYIQKVLHLQQMLSMHLYEKAELVRLSSLTKVLLTFPLVVAICRLAIAKKLCVTAKEFTIR